MKIFRTLTAFLASAALTFVLAAVFYTQQVISRQAAIGVEYSAPQKFSTLLDNILGLAPSYGVVLAIGLAIAFPVAALLKRVLKPLAPLAFPLAGAAAVYTAIYLIENVVASGGVGALGGARGTLGMVLQCLAGLIGGGAFALLRPK